MTWETAIGQFGVSGVIIVGLVWDRMRLLKENESLQKEVRSLFKDNAETLKGLTQTIKSIMPPQKGD